MTSHEPRRRQFLRDLPQAYVLLACAAFGMTVLIFVSYYWSPVRRGSGVVLQSSNANNDDRYVGSVMTDPPRGDMCLKRMFDNRTGNMVDYGYVKCEDPPPQLSDNQPHDLNASRLREVGKTFRGN